MRIEQSFVKSWQIASKTRPIKAKPLINLLVDRTVTSKFLVDCLEGKEPLRNGVVICIGEAGDVWQQMPKKLLQKYTVKAIDADGWMVCEPLPDNAVDCVEVTEAMSKGSVCFTIIGQWGATTENEKNVQKGCVGDFLCRNRNDNTDWWVVNRKLFLNTYVIKS